MVASSNAGDKACSSYDVFLSFRGEDTRHSFTDHLYNKLDQASIHTFRDKEEVNKGEQLQPEFERAIKASRASIVVLSKNYATSSWCLDELVLILEQRRECNHFVLPIFYHVEPTDVRNQKGSFAIRVDASSLKWTEHNVNKWKTALKEVADLDGVVVVGYETSILNEVLDIVFDKLDGKEVSLPRNITGMETHYKEISSWLEQCNLPFLVIYGIGGSGKTILAKYIYNSNLKYFEYVSFIEDIGSKCEKHNGLLELQEQLMKDMSEGKKRTVPSVSRGTCIIAKELEMKKALIVLDDIVMEQLDPLLGIGKINKESKIIITTREKVDDWPCWSYWRCQKYEMVLNEDEASELLCRHAFGSKTPMVGFENHVLQAVQYCQGNPLAIELLGNSLFNNDIENWESQLRLWERDIDTRVQDVLIRSYTSLQNIPLKNLFLHIACFFAGKDVDYVTQILDPDYEARSGIKILINRGLLSVSPNKKLIMHRLVQEMGKHIVRIESSQPAKRSRVWLSGESYKILEKRRGSKTVEGLLLDMKMLLEDKSSKLNTDALNNMDSLKLLQLNFVELSGSYENFSEDLRWLCWLKFHLRTIPFYLCMQKLVAIDLSYSNLEVFDPPTVTNPISFLFNMVVKSARC